MTKPFKSLIEEATEKSVAKFSPCYDSADNGSFDEQGAARDACSLPNELLVMALQALDSYVKHSSSPDHAFETIESIRTKLEGASK